MKKHPGLPDSDPQLRKAEYIAALVTGYIQQSLNHVEHDELDSWVQAADNNMVLFEDITDDKKLQSDLGFLEDADIKDAWKKCVQRISFK